MRIRWLESAILDLQHIQEYIADDNPFAANRIASRIYQSVSKLIDHPNLGRLGRVSGTRELIVSGTPYLIPYCVKRDTVEILRVYHGAMQWPDHF